MGAFSRLGILGQPSLLDLAIDDSTPLCLEAC